MGVTIDGVSTQLQEGIKTLLAPRGKPPRRVKNLLHGTPIGHPAHPAIVAVPIGALATAALFDALWLTNRGARGWAARAARMATLVGGAGAAASIATGMADWSETNGSPRRLGLLHGALNVGAFGVFATSLLLRLRHKDGDSVAAAVLGFVGTAILTVTGYLGGEIAYRDGVDVNHTAWEDPPTEFTPVIPLDSLPEGKLTRVSDEGTPVVLLRDGDTVYAIAATCTHAGGPLDQGTLDGLRVTCPWHGSQFCLVDGHVKDGPATAPAPRYDARIHNGQVGIRPTRG